MTRQDLIIKVPKILPARGCADDIPISPLKINAYCLLELAGGVRDYEWHGDSKELWLDRSQAVFIKTHPIASVRRWLLRGVGFNWNVCTQILWPQLISLKWVRWELIKCTNIYCEHSISYTVQRNYCTYKLVYCCWQTWCSFKSLHTSIFCQEWSKYQMEWIYI